MPYPAQPYSLPNYRQSPPRGGRLDNSDDDGPRAAQRTRLLLREDGGRLRDLLSQATYGGRQKGF